MDNEEEKFTDKFSRKTQESPFIILGVVGVIGSCGYAAWRYKTKGPAISTSTFLMSLRVLAQGLFAGCCLIGVVSQVITDYKLEQEKKKAKALKMIET